MRQAWMVALLLLACSRENPIPLDRQLWRIEGGWRAGEEAGVRAAPATIIAFRSSGEFVELHCWLVEQADTTVYLAAQRPFVAGVGRWERDGDALRVRRERVFRSARPDSAADPLCTRALTFRLSGNSVTGNLLGTGEGTYSPVTRLVAPDFESYINAAKEKGTRCSSERG